MRNTKGIERIKVSRTAKVATPFAAALAFLGAGCSFDTDQATDFGKIMRQRFYQAYSPDISQKKFSTDGLKLRELQFPDEISLRSAFEKAADRMRTNGAAIFAVQRSFVSDLATVECATVAINNLASEDETAQIYEQFKSGEERAEAIGDNVANSTYQRENNPYYVAAEKLCGKLVLEAAKDSKQITIPVDLAE